MPTLTQKTAGVSILKVVLYRRIGILLAQDLDTTSQTDRLCKCAVEAGYAGGKLRSWLIASTESIRPYTLHSHCEPSNLYCSVSTSFLLRLMSFIYADRLSSASSSSGHADLAWLLCNTTSIVFDASRVERAFYKTVLVF